MPEIIRRQLVLLRGLCVSIYGALSAHKPPSFSDSRHLLNHYNAFMRTSRLIAVLLFFVFGAISACKKYDYNGVQTPASVTVVNAMFESHSICPLFGVPPAQYWNIRQRVPFTGSFAFSPPKDSNALLIVPITDTGFTIFQGKMPIVSGGIYSFFLAGDTTKPDTMFVKDEIPYYTDSSVGLRIVNCMGGGKSISVNLVGNDPSTQAEVSNLGYMQITSFKKYAVDPNLMVYSFEIHDQATGDLLGTFDWYYTTYKNNTLVIGGNADPSIGVMPFTVNNYY